MLCLCYSEAPVCHRSTRHFAETEG
jgi:hypothetical protein